MATAQSVNEYTKVQRPRNAGLGWYKSFANGIQEHYNCDYLEEEDLEEQSGDVSPPEDANEPEELPEDFYLVERLVAKRKKGATTEYLVLWKGWPNEASQWVSSDNIGSALIRYYDNPQPQEHLIREAAAQFTYSIDRSLRTECIKNTVLRLPFRHDIYRFLFKDKDTDKLQLTDFSTEYFLYGWNQWCQQYSSSDGLMYCGRTIVFPIKISSYLQWTK